MESDIHKLAVWICNRARIPDRRLSDGHGLEQDGGRTLEGQPSMENLLPSIADCCPRNASTAEHPAPSLVSLALHTSAAGHCFWTLRAGGTNYAIVRLWRTGPNRHGQTALSPVGSEGTSSRPPQQGLKIV